jgi:hypothetical protein
LNMSDDLERALADSIDEVGREVLDFFSDQYVRAYENVKELMPTKTGRTVDGTRMKIELDLDGTIEGKVRAPPWVKYIASPQIGEDPLHINYQKHLAGEEYIDGQGRRRKKKWGPIRANAEEKRQRAQAIARRAKKSRRKAAREGRPRWILLGWQKQILLEHLEPFVLDTILKQFDDLEKD